MVLLSRSSAKSRMLQGEYQTLTTGGRRDATEKTAAMTTVAPMAGTEVVLVEMPRVVSVAAAAVVVLVVSVLASVAAMLGTTVEVAGAAVAVEIMAELASKVVWS